MNQFILVVIGAGSGTIIGELLLRFVTRWLKDRSWRKRFIKRDKKELAKEIVKIITWEDVLGREGYNSIVEIVNQLFIIGEEKTSSLLKQYLDEAVNLQLGEAMPLPEGKEKEIAKIVAKARRKTDRLKKELLTSAKELNR